MSDPVPIRDRMLFEFRTPTIYVTQWDGTKAQCVLLLGELERIVEEIGASVISAHYSARLSDPGGQTLSVSIGRHEDGFEWDGALSRNEWLVVWRDLHRVVDVEILSPETGEARFRPVAPVIVLQGRAPEIED